MREAKQVEEDEKKQAEGEGERTGWWYASDCLTADCMNTGLSLV